MRLEARYGSNGVSVELIMLLSSCGGFRVAKNLRSLLIAAYTLDDQWEQGTLYIYIMKLTSISLIIQLVSQLDNRDSHWQ